MSKPYAADLSLPTLTHILVATSQITGLPVSEITAPPRQRGKLHHRYRARQFATYVARVTSKRSWAMIGRRLNRDHATVMAAFETACALVRRNDAETIVAINEITKLAWQLHAQQQEQVAGAA